MGTCLRYHLLMCVIRKKDRKLLCELVIPEASFSHEQREWLGKLRCLVSSLVFAGCHIAKFSETTHVVRGENLRLA